MAPRTQTKTATVPVVAIPAPVSAPIPTEKAARSAPSKKAVVSAPTPVSATIVSTPVIVDDATTNDSSRESRYKSVLASIDAQVATLKELRALAVANYKTDSVELKLAQKSSGRRRRQVRKWRTSA